MKKHVDVGEKIGGARKDFYVKSLNLDDFANMNEAEREALVVKDNIFPPVNWRQWERRRRRDTSNSLYREIHSRRIGNQNHAFLFKTL